MRARGGGFGQRAASSGGSCASSERPASLCGAVGGQRRQASLLYSLGSRYCEGGCGSAWPAMQRDYHLDLNLNVNLDGRHLALLVAAYFLWQYLFAGDALMPGQPGHAEPAGRREPQLYRTE